MVHLLYRLYCVDAPANPNPKPNPNFGELGRHLLSILSYQSDPVIRPLWDYSDVTETLSRQSLQYNTIQFIIQFIKKHFCLKKRPYLVAYLLNLKNGLPAPAWINVRLCNVYIETCKVECTKTVSYRSVRSLVVCVICPTSYPCDRLPFRTSSARRNREIINPWYRQARKHYNHPGLELSGAGGLGGWTPPVHVYRRSFLSENWS